MGAVLTTHYQYPSIRKSIGGRAIAGTENDDDVLFGSQRQTTGGRALYRSETRAIPEAESSRSDDASRFRLAVWCLILFGILPFVHGQESEISYWRDYFHQTGPHTFDAEASRYGELRRADIKTTSTYTVVSSESGRVAEAISMLDGEPNYYYSYLYDDEDRLIETRMEALVDSQPLLLSRVVYSYSEEGQLLSTGYYTANPFDNRGPVLQYVKEFSGRNYQLHDYRQQEPSREIIDRLDVIGEQLEQLNELESRGLLRRLLGAN